MTQETELSPVQISVPNQLLLAQKVANLTDTAVRIPFTRIKLGLDFLVGLIPGIGDTIMLGVSASIIMMGKSMGAPKRILFKMIRNSLVDFLLGLIPFLGDLADMFYRANQANVRLLERWWVTHNKDHLDANTQKKLQQWQEDNN